MIKINPALREDGTGNITVFVDHTDLFHKVEISIAHKNLFYQGENPKALKIEINWSGIGSVDSEYARKYAEAIVYASDVADFCKTFLCIAKFDPAGLELAIEEKYLLLTEEDNTSYWAKRKS